MIYREILPSEQLRDTILNYWIFKVAEDNHIDFPIQHETLPDSNVSIVLIRQPNFHGVRLLGPHTHKFRQSIAANSTFIGIRIQPWISFKTPLFNKTEITNKTVDAPPFISQHFCKIVEFDLKLNASLFELLENNLLMLIKDNQTEKNDLVKFICTELSQGRKIASIIDRTPHSVRVVQKLFKRTTGITMRQYASNVRQRKLWLDLLDGDFDRLDAILKHNYYDQAHFINEFKKKMKRSPTDFELYIKSISASHIN